MVGNMRTFTKTQGRERGLAHSTLVGSSGVPPEIHGHLERGLDLVGDSRLMDRIWKHEVMLPLSC